MAEAGKIWLKWLNATKKGDLQNSRADELNELILTGPKSWHIRSYLLLPVGIPFWGGLSVIIRNVALLSVSGQAQSLWKVPPPGDTAQKRYLRNKILRNICGRGTSVKGWCGVGDLGGDSMPSSPGALWQRDKLYAEKPSVASKAPSKNRHAS